MNKANSLPKFDLRSYLTIVGLASTIIFGSELIFTISGGLGLERQEWIQYLLLGTLFPALAFILVFAKKKAFLPKIVAVVEFFFVFAACIFFLSIVTGNLLKSSVAEFIVAIVASLLQVCITYFIAQHQIWFFSKKNILDGVLFSVILVAVWMAGIRFITHRYSWTDSSYVIEWWFWPGWPGNFTGVIQPSFLRRLILFATVVFLTTFNFSQETPLYNFNQLSIGFRVNKRLLLFLFDVFAIALFFLLCITTDRILNSDIQGHIDLFLSPIVALKQGAWLLWDQPSMYGFLWVVLVALIPTKNTVIALVLFLGIINFSLSVLLYITYSSYKQKSLINRIIAFFLVTASFLVRSFQNQDFSLTAINGNFTEAYSFWYWLTPTDIPQVSAIRTIWCCVLILIASRYYFDTKDNFKIVSVSGCVIWAVGCFWSAESAIFSTATWIPAYFFIIFIKRQYKWFLLPGIVISAPIILLNFYYLFWLGHTPEWSALFEFSSGFSFGGIWGIPIPRSGSIWSVILLMIILVGISLACSWDKIKDPAIGACLACFGALWSSTSYYVGLSLNAKLHVLVHIYVLVAFILIKILDQNKRTSLKIKHNVYFVFRFSLTVYITIILVCGLDFDRTGLTTFFDSQLNRSYSIFDLRKYRTVIPSSMSVIINQANVQPKDNIMLANSFGNISMWQDQNGDYVTDQGVWLPTVSNLSDSRRQIYIERFVKRTCLGGWLITPQMLNNILLSQPDILIETSLQKPLIEYTNIFIKSIEYSNPDWVLVYYEPNFDKLVNCVRN